MALTIMTLADFVKAVPWDVKDEAWDQAILDNLIANDIKVIHFLFAFNLISLCICQTLNCLKGIKYEDVSWNGMTPGKRNFAKVFVYCQCYLHMASIHAGCVCRV